MTKNIIKNAAKDTLPVMAGYLTLGCGFGILLFTRGYGWPWALLMSTAVYAGSMQYAAVGLIAAQASLPAVFLMTVMVNIRHLFYGISMLKKYEGAGTRKPYLIFALTDETYSLVCSRENMQKEEFYRYCFTVSLLDQIYWVVGSVAGSLLAYKLKFNSAGIDFAMTALFVVIVTEQWEKEPVHLTALTGFAVSLLSLLVFGKDRFLIPAMIGITCVLFLLKDKLADGRAEELKEKPVDIRTEKLTAGEEELS